uniref:Uncharacterized protein n=1 Tax=Arundo donax TaxID=35708 RepID=A0A0A8YK89_ARUDO
MTRPTSIKRRGIIIIRNTNVDHQSYFSIMSYAVKTEGWLMVQAATSRILLLSIERGRTTGTSLQSSETQPGEISQKDVTAHTYI